MTGGQGVLLMTFGSAVTSEDVPAYLASVRAGREVPPELVAEFRRRYDRIGRSPLIDITRAQTEALQSELERRDGPGCWHVAMGMLHCSPRIAESAGHLARRGVQRILAITLAPQYSPIILAGYERAIERARSDHPIVDIAIAGEWHLDSAWIDCLAERLQEALAGIAPQVRGRVPIVFTAHSLPRAVVDRDPSYIDQLKQTATGVAARAGLPDDHWRFAYQSAGHTPEEWLAPDVKDILPELASNGIRHILVVPLQFVADHLEILYDIDVAAREEAACHGIRLHRIQLPNASPAFIRALVQVVDRATRSPSRRHGVR